MVGARTHRPGPSHSSHGSHTYSSGTGSIDCSSDQSNLAQYTRGRPDSGSGATNASISRIDRSPST